MGNCLPLLALRALLSDSPSLWYTGGKEGGDEVAIINPNPEEASILKRILGDRTVAVVNLGDRQVVIEILDEQSAQSVLDAVLSDPAEAARTRESIRQRKDHQGISLAEVKAKYLDG